MQLPARNLPYSILGIQGYIFDIQGLSVHDGPGCRTLIFLKGCPLNCVWCSNPEGISPLPSLMYYSSKCIACGNCAAACRHNAIEIENGYLKISSELCNVCKTHNCVKECYTDALKLCGYKITSARLMEIIRRDRQFWGSGGGVTLTGGEPLLQIDFAKEILQECHRAYIHTAVETCGNVPWENFTDILPYLDWIFFDIKHLDSIEHKKATGCGNSQILENARMLSKVFPGRVIFRMPLVPGFNDTEENIDSLTAFLKETGRNEINILPLHHLGREKYRMLNKNYSGDTYFIQDAQNHNKARSLTEIQTLFRANGIECYTGSETPF